MPSALTEAFSERGAARSIEAFHAAARAWTRLGPADDARWMFVPGRVEVLGKHTDYAGGATLTCAVERGFSVAYSPRADDTLRVADAGRGETISIAVSPELTVPQGHWSNYPSTAARRLARNMASSLRGADVAFVSTLPSAAGLSSSSAFITAVTLVLVDVNRLEAHPRFRAEVPDRLALAGYLGSVENGQAFGAFAGDRGVGTFGGSEDHTALLCSEADRLGHFAFCPVRRLASLPVPPGYIFVVAASGVTAAKTGNARERYNRASLQAAAILEQWRAGTGRSDATLEAAVTSSAGAVDELRALLKRERGAYPAADLLRRLDHFLVENQQLVPAAAAALAAGDLPAFGAAARESQRAAEDLLGNQVPETSTLARLAREQGAAAASAFGAGFGGSVWALVPVEEAERFAATWRTAYSTVAGPSVLARAVFFVTAAGPPVSLWSPDGERVN